MPDSPSRAPRRAGLILAVAGVCAVALAAAVAATGGIDWSIGALRVRVHQPWRLLAAGLCLVAAAWWVGGARGRAALSRAWDARDRLAAWLAAAAAAITMLVGLVKGTRVAGSADAYGYVSQALLWLKGLPVQTEPLAALVPWPRAEWSLSPLGYRPGLEPGVIVPTYPPGLPLAMAAAAGIGGADAVYWVVPALGAAAVWLTFLIGRRYADAGSGAAAALLVAASPVFLYQLVQPMSDVPVTACWLLALWGAAAGRPFAAGLGAGAAVLTRPNLAPLAPLVIAAVVAHAHRQSLKPRAVLHAAVMCALPVAAAAGFLAWLNTRLYGSPLASGYGAASDLFALAHVPVNSARYLRWLLETQTPFVLLALAAPFAARIRRPAGPGASQTAQAWFGLGFAALVLACYLPYSPFEEWWYLRFLLPAIPVLLVLAASVLVRLRRPCQPPCAGRWSWPASGSSRGSTSPRPSSAAPSILIASRAVMWRPARSPHERCPNAPSCSACRRAARCGCTAVERRCGSITSIRKASTRPWRFSNARARAPTSPSRPGRRPSSGSGSPDRARWACSTGPRWPRSAGP